MPARPGRLGEHPFLHVRGGCLPGRPAVAKAKGTVQFVELATVADMPLDGDEDVAALGRVLDEIAEQEVAAGRPLLPVLVVHGTRNMPGAGLFKFAKKNKLQKGDDLTFFATEMAQVDLAP